MKITLNKKAYTLRFGYGCLKLLATIWQCSLQELFVRLGDIQGKEIEVCVDLVWCALCVGNPDVDFNKDDVGDYVLNNVKTLPEIIGELQKSMPQPEPEPVGKPIPSLEKVANP